MMTGSTLILRSRLREGPGEGLSRYCNCNRPRRDRLFRQITQQTVPMRQCGGDRIDRHALLEPMGAAVARLRNQPRDAVTRHAAGAEIQAGGARQSGGKGQEVSGRVELGGLSSLNKKRKK